jgi:hypothetical protein
MIKQSTTYCLVLLLLFSFCTNTITAQGKFAGSLSNLVGKSYTDSRYIKGLKGWQFRQGSLLTPIDDPETITVQVFQKGTTNVVVFGFMEDTSSHVYVIADVIEVKNIKKGWEIQTGLCRQNKIDNAEIVALIKPTSEQYMTQVKQAWRFSRDKRRVEALSVKGIDCINEGGQD